MRHSLGKFIFILFLVKIDRLHGRALEVVYTGDACECTKNLPLQVNVPVAAAPVAVPCATHGYKIEVPPPPPAAPAKCPHSYAFDVVVEEPIAILPKPPCKANLFAAIDKAVVPKADCVETIPVAVPAPPAAPVVVAVPPAPVVVAPQPAPCAMCAAAPAPAPAALSVIEYDYAPVAVAPLPAPALGSCLCGKCNDPLKPQCRYVLKGIQINRIRKGRSKRDVSSRKEQYISDIRDIVKSLKSAREARKLKKSKLVKRDIKGEYDLLQREQSFMDLTIPDIIQYMPETMNPNFKRGKCNFGCENCIKKESKEQQENKDSPQLPVETSNSEQNNPTEPETAKKVLNESTHAMLNQHFHTNPHYAEASYLKRSVNPFQYPYPCYPGLMPPPYIPSAMELATTAQNPGNPIWYQPRPLIDPNGHYVYDRLGHKYEVKNGSLKLVTPKYSDGDEVNRSTPNGSDGIVANEEDNNDQSKTLDAVSHQALNAAAQHTLDSEAQKAIDSALRQHVITEVSTPVASVNADSQSIQAPTVGAPSSAPAHHDPSYDPQMDKVIRDIIYQHPDFIEASQHAPGSLTLPQDVQRDETMQFLDKLIQGRLNNWFRTPTEEVPMHNLQDLNRYSRETGTSIKFIPIVTVDKDRLNKYRQEQVVAST